MSADQTGSSSACGRRDFRSTAIASGLLTSAEIDEAEAAARAALGVAQPGDGSLDTAIAGILVERSKLTRFQADQMLLGRTKLTLGQYVIVDQLGQGGMGQVFKARHCVMGRLVAVKVLPRAKSTPETEAAFRREIEVLGQLDHENLVRALDAGYDGKVYFLVTELVPGLDLRRQVSRHGVLDEIMAASVVSQAAKGLAYAHSAGLVHRDVKPGNILVREDGRAKVSDLGLAGSVVDSGDELLPKRLMGTMDYMAPEQIRHPDRPQPSADIYSLGCTLYFAVTGQVPFPGGTREEKARRHRAEEPTSVRQLAPNVTPEFAGVIVEMMRKDPHDRVPSAEAVVDLLRRWTPPEPVAMLRTASRNRSRQAVVSSRKGSRAVVGSGMESEVSGGIEMSSYEGRSRGESSFGPGQSTPGLNGGSMETLLELEPTPSARRGERGEGRMLSSIDRRLDAVVSVFSRAALVGFLFGLVIVALQSSFGDAWEALGLAFLHFWSATMVAFGATAAILWMVGGVGGERTEETANTRKTTDSR